MAAKPNTPQPANLDESYKMAQNALDALNRQMDTAAAHSASWKMDTVERLPRSSAWIDRQQKAMSAVTAPLPSLPYLSTLIFRVRAERQMRMFNPRIIRFRLRTRYLRVKYTVLYTWRARGFIATYGLGIAALLLWLQSAPPILIIIRELLGALF